MWYLINEVEIRDCAYKVCIKMINSQEESDFTNRSQSNNWNNEIKDTNSSNITLTWYFFQRKNTDNFLKSTETIK